MNDSIDLSQLVMCTCNNLRMAARAVTQHYATFDQETGLRPTQITLLSVTQMFGPIPITQLAEMLNMDRTTLTRNLKPLESRGLLTVTTGDDKRTRFVEITPVGSETVVVGLGGWQQAQQSMIDHLGEEDWRELIRLLGKVVAVTKQ